MPETRETWRREPAEELGLVDVWLVLKPHWPWIAACALALAVAALVFSLMAPPVWEGAATILPGYVWQPGQTSPQPLELVTRSAERLRARSFGDAVLRKSGLQASESDAEARLFRDSIRVTQPPGADLLHIVVRAHSIRLATGLLAGMIEEIRSVQDELLKPTLTRFRADLANVRDDLARARSEAVRLRTLRDAENGLAPANRFAQSVQLGAQIAARTLQIDSLQQRQLLLEESLDPAKSHGVLVVDTVRVGDRPVSPKPVRNTFFGALLGLFVGVFGVLLWAGASAGSARRVPEPSPGTSEERTSRGRGL